MESSTMLCTQALVSSMALLSMSIMIWKPRVSLTNSNVRRLGVYHLLPATSQWQRGMKAGGLCSRAAFKIAHQRMRISHFYTHTAVMLKS
jgi:hypothetical protein